MTAAARGAAAVLALAAAAAGQPPAAWRGFERILWLRDDAAGDDAFLDRVADLGYTAVSVGAGADPAAPARHGLRFYADQLAGKGILELRDGPWHERADAYAKSRDPSALARPTCLSSPATAVALADAVAGRLAAVLPQRPIAASLADEASVTRHNNPLDFCTAPDCIAAFREFLRRRYGTVEALDAAWLTVFGRWADVEPLTADRVRARELGGTALPRNLRAWSDHCEFMDGRLAAAVAAAATQVQRAAPGLPVGLTGMQPPTAYGGHDFAALMPSCSFFEAYDIGGARDLAACLAPAGARQVATLFPPGAGEPLELVRARLFDAIAHGLAGVVIWSSTEVRSGGEATPYGAALRRALGDLAAPADAAAGAELLRSPVWLVESQASVRAHWMLDSAGDGDGWIRRLSSYEHAHSTSLAARASWLRLLEDLGLQGRLVAAAELPAALRRESPRVLVLPASVALADATIAAVEAYVRAGGTAVADHGLALYDAGLGRRDTGGLDAVFGLRDRSLLWRDQLVREGRPAESARLRSGAAAAEAAIGGALGEPAEPYTVQIEHVVEAGRTVYLNLAVCEYAAVRLDPTRLAAARDLRRRVGSVLWAAGVRPVVGARGDGLPTCVERMLLRTPAGRTLLAVRLNALERPALLEQMAGRGPCQVTLTFAEPMDLTDLRSGAKHLGFRELSVDLDPWTGLLFDLQPSR